MYMFTNVKNLLVRLYYLSLQLYKCEYIKTTKFNRLHLFSQFIPGDLSGEEIVLDPDLLTLVLPF